MKRIALLLPLLLLGGCGYSPHSDENWDYLGPLASRIDDGVIGYAFADKRSFHSQLSGGEVNPYFSYTLKIEKIKAKLPKYPGAEKSLMRVRANCVNSTMQILETNLYDKDGNLIGNVPETSIVDTSDIPAYQKVIKMTCDGKDTKGCDS